MIDVLLNAFGFVTSGDQRARLLRFLALFDADMLIKLVAVGLHIVDDDAPFALNVNGPQWLNVSRLTRAQVSLFDQLVKSVDRIGCLDLPDNREIDSRTNNAMQFNFIHLDVTVQGADGLVVLVQSVHHIVAGVVGIFQAPRLARVLRAFRCLWLVLGLIVRHSALVGCRILAGHSGKNAQAQ